MRYILAPNSRVCQVYNSLCQGLLGAGGEVVAFELEVEAASRET